MATVKVFIRTTAKKDKSVNVRFRLSDGRNVQLFHKSEILVTPNLFDKDTGHYKARALVNMEDRLRFNASIDERVNLLMSIYTEHKDLSSDKLDELVDKSLHPEKYNIKSNESSFCDMFNDYVNRWYDNNVIGLGRKKHYDVIINELKRFFVINGMKNCKVKDFTKDEVFKFREFLRIEYQYTGIYPSLYEGMNQRNKPTKERSQNTIAGKLLLLQTFLNALEEDDYIAVSPFRKLGSLRKSMMKQQYDEPFFLTMAEFEMIAKSECPKELQRVRDLFIVHCSFGCRVGDFRGLTIDNVGVDGGIPFIHYLPQKTQNNEQIRKEIKTPIIRLAYDIIMKYKEVQPHGRLLPFYPEGNGETGYNYQIKKLLETFNIDRKVAVFNTETNKNEYVSICKIASSKLARKTHVDMMNKVQIDKYVAGLHKVGSGAVDRYTNLGVADRFKMMNVAFGCDDYRVDDNLELIKG